MTKKFIDGLFFNLPHEKAPQFIKGSIAISKAKFLEWLQKEDTNENGYIKIDLKISKAGKPYAEVNNWKPENQAVLNKQIIDINEEINIEEFPF